MKAKALRILQWEDNPGDARLLPPDVYQRNRQLRIDPAFAPARSKENRT